MPDNFDAVAYAQTLLKRFLHGLQQTWIEILQWDSQKHGVSPTFLFFSPSFILICFTIINHCSTHSSQFSLVIFVLLLLHAILKLTHNPISANLHYQFLYSCILTFFILYYSPALPYNQVRILLSALFPIYYYTLTSSMSITLLISSPILLFLVCSSFQESFSNTTLPAALIVIPTIFWTKVREMEQTETITQHQRRDLFKNEKNVLYSNEKIFIPDLSERETSVEKMPSDTGTEENEKVILGISHDCRNLLNSLKAILTIMKDDLNGNEVESTQDDNLQSAIAISEHLGLLLTNLLDYLKAKNQGSTGNEEMKLTTTLEKIWLMISPNLKRKFLGGSITIKHGTPLSICLDERKFMGVLLNLIGNAMKFTDTGHIKINVNWRENLSDSQNLSFGSRDAKANIPIPGVVLKKPGFSPAKTENSPMLDSDQANAVFSKTTFFDMRDIDSISFTKKCFTVMGEASHYGQRPMSGVLVVTVRDTGCGIDEESLKKLFKKYGQVGEDKEKSKLGLGLGLWYTKYLLGKLNGKIDFRSTKNVGTWVKIEIPCKVSQQNKRELRQMINPIIPIQRKIGDSTKKVCVFVREDDKLVSLLISEYLKKHLNRGIDVIEIKSIYDILSSEKLRNAACAVVTGKRSVTRQEIQGLRMLNRVQKEGQRVPVVLVRETEDVIESVDDSWDNVDIRLSVRKPMKQLQLDQVVKSVDAGLDKILGLENIHKDDIAHVLIVDDENTSVLFLQKYLGKLGIQCLVARDGDEAVGIYRDKWADIKLVLMDSEMPKMNGIDATKAIRCMKKDTGLKIVGLTGNDSEAFKIRAKETGMNEVYVKPVSTEKLLQIVNNALEIRA